MIAAFPLLVRWVRLAWARLPHKKPVIAGNDSVAEWRSRWVQTLMVLQSELEAKSDQQASLKLCKQLIWQVLGGGPVA